MSIPRILIIAGSDSGGGAGIQADIKTVTMLGGHAMTAITAITAQNTLGVSKVMPVPTGLVIEQIDMVAADIGVDAVKIGMIGSAETAEAVAVRLAELRELAPERLPIVFDPVMVASSGATLADPATIAAFRKLGAIASLVTPNAPELAALTGMPVRTEKEMDAAAYELARDRLGYVLAKGGHLPGDKVVDLLLDPDGRSMRWTSSRLPIRHDHGTGCTLASAIATELGRLTPLPQAVETARSFVRSAMRAAPGFGGGRGPMGHWAAANGLLNLNQVTLPAREYAEAVDFYRRLGLTQIVDSPANGYARFECPGGATLSIHVEPSPKVGDAVVYLEVQRVDAWTRRLLDREGIRLDQEPRDESWGWREARLRDPTGNHLCLYWAGENRRFPPWRISTEN